MDASGLTTAEVRSQYALPLMREILQVSGLIDQAAVLGSIDIDIGTSTSTITDAAPSGSRPVSTLFQEIAAEYTSIGEAVRGQSDEKDTVGTSPRCWAEVRDLLTIIISMFCMLRSLTLLCYCTAPVTPLPIKF